MSDLIKSVYENQEDILNAIQRLYCVEGFDCDLTYGNGRFWKNITPPALCFDLQPLLPHVIKADSRSIPLKDGSLNNVVFDPPFLTYIRSGREGNGKMALAQQFSGYWRYDELEDHYFKTIADVARVLKVKGKLIFKCQDIIHNHKMHCTHAKVIEMANKYGMSLVDLFVLVAKNRMPSPNRKGTQKHARIFHSYFLIFEKNG